MPRIINTHLTIELFYQYIRIHGFNIITMRVSLRGNVVAVGAEFYQLDIVGRDFVHGLTFEIEF